METAGFVRSQITRREFVAGALAVTAAPAVSAQTAAPRPGGTLRVGTLEDTRTLNPLRYTGYAETMIFPVAEGLVRVGEGGQVHPLLAEKWDNPDPRTYAFHLRKGVRFHNGSELTAEDVVASYDFVLAKDFTGALKGYVTMIDRVQATDRHTVRMTLKHPFAPIMFSAHGIRILAKNAWDQVDKNPVGTGPFKFVEWVPKDHLKLQKFPGYWRAGLPYLDEVYYKIAPDPQSGYLSFKAGDMEVAVHDIMVRDNLLEARKTAKVQLVGPKVDPRYELIYFDCAHAPTSDVRVRQAVAHLVNREQISEVVYDGIFKPAPWVFPPGHWAHNPAIRQLGYDPARAKKLITDSGVKELTFTTWSNRPQMRQIAEIVQQEAARIGFTMKVEVLEPAKYLEKTNPHGKTYHLANTTYRRDYDPWFYLLYYRPPNESNYDNPRVTELFEKAASSSRQDEQKAAMDQIQKIINEEVPKIILVYGSTLYAAQPYVRNLQVPFRGQEYELTETWLDR
jgi:peptide/nickel transport system substrate-binding protein